MNESQLQTKSTQTIEITLRGPDGQIKQQDTITKEVTHGNSD